MSGSISIRISTELRDELSELKVHPEESYEDVIKRLVEMCIDDEPLSNTTVQAIEESMADIRAGRVSSLEDVARVLMHSEKLVLLSKQRREELSSPVSPQNRNPSVRLRGYR